MRDTKSTAIRRSEDHAAGANGVGHHALLRRLLSSDPESCRLFWDDEDAYLAWVYANQDGYIINCDKAGVMKMYPMIHRAVHRSMWTPSRANYTTGNYFKVCSRIDSDLDIWAANRAMVMTRCRIGKCA